MSQVSYDYFLHHALDLYGKGETQAALEFVQQYGADFPKQDGLVDILRICLFGVNGHSERALQMFQAFVDKGYWWSTEGLRAEEDLASLRGNPEFERLLAVCAEREAQAQQNPQPELVIFAPAADAPRPYPLLLALHGRGDNAYAFASYWQELTKLGWLVAMPQSSQLGGTEARRWDDLELTERELQAHFATLSSRYPIDAQRVLIGGMSQGGGVAIWMAVAHKLPVVGFIGVAPFWRGIDELTPKLPAEPAPGLRGYMVTGGLDQDNGMFDKFEALLKARSIPYQRENHPDIGHAFPPDFDRTLQSALAFIFPA